MDGHGGRKVGHGFSGEPDVDEFGAAERSGGHQRVAAAADPVALHAAQVDRDPRHRADFVSGRAERLQAAHADRRRAFASGHLEPVVDAHRARTQRARDDGAAAADREAPVDPQPDGRGGVGRGQAGDHPVEGGA